MGDNFKYKILLRKTECTEICYYYVFCPYVIVIVIHNWETNKQINKIQIKYNDPKNQRKKRICYPDRCVHLVVVHISYIWLCYFRLVSILFFSIGSFSIIIDFPDFFSVLLFKLLRNHSLSFLRFGLLHYSIADLMRHIRN